MATDSTKVIYKEAKKLLSQLHKGERIRLIGLRVESLVSKEEMQMSLFDVKDTKKQEEIDKTVDNIKQKYGYNIISRAGILNIKNEIKYKDK